MQGMCRTCCTFHAASLSLLCHMPIPTSACALPCALSLFQWPISPSHVPFGEATTFPYSHLLLYLLDSFAHLHPPPSQLSLTCHFTCLYIQLQALSPCMYMVAYLEKEQNYAPCQLQLSIDNSQGYF